MGGLKAYRVAVTVGTRGRPGGSGGPRNKGGRGACRDSGYGSRWHGAQNAGGGHGRGARVRVDGLGLKA